MDQDRPTEFHDKPAPITPRTVLGIAIALLGVVLLLDRLGLAEAHYVLRFWPVPMIVIGALIIVQAHDGRDRTRGLIIAAIGTWFFLSTQGLISVRIWQLFFRLFFPLLLVFIGFSLMFRTGGSRRRRRRYGPGSSFGPLGPSGPFGPTGPVGPEGPLGRGTTEPASPAGPVASFGSTEPAPTASGTPGPTMPMPRGAERDERLSMFAVWSSVRRASAASPFRGGDITAIMGGGQLDLRLATIPPGQEAVLDIMAIMGGVEIFVPPHWEVLTPILPFMGGVEDRRLRLLPGDPSALSKDASGRLVLRGFVMMGGVHIKS